MKKAQTDWKKTKQKTPNVGEKDSETKKITLISWMSA